MKKHYLSALVALSITTYAFAGSPYDFTGTIWLTAGSYCPQGTVEADGRRLMINDTKNQALYALYGTTYGGDGKTYFNVPDMQARVPIGAGKISDISMVQRGDKVGQTSTVLTPSTIPAHSHTAKLIYPFTKVKIPVSATEGNTTIPSLSANYLAASPSGNPGARMWSNTKGTNPISLAGVTSSGGVLEGIVKISPNGFHDPKPITTIPPQLGLRFCIVTDGTFPVQ